MKAVTITSTTLLLILIPALIFMNNQAYYHANIGGKDILGTEKAKSLGTNVIQFLNGEKPLTNNFTKEEKSHMEDVKKIQDWMKALLALSLAGIIISYSLEKDKPEFLANVRKGTIITGTFIALLALFAILSFNTTFIYFHELFFPQGNWQFPANSTLITLFPEEFFIKITTTIITATLLLSIILYIKTKIIQRIIIKEQQ